MHFVIKNARVLNVEDVNKFNIVVKIARKCIGKIIRKNAKEIHLSKWMLIILKIGRLLGMVIFQKYIQFFVNIEKKNLH